MGDATKIKIGACNVTYNNVDLGLTMGGVEIEATTSAHETKVDQFGETIVNEYITGRTLKVKVPLAESDLAMLLNVVPGSTLVTDAITPTKKRLDIPTGNGLSLRDYAFKLVCHPAALGATDKNEDLVVALAAPKGDLSFAYKHDEERIYMVEFVGYPDVATGALYSIGDDTATP